ncbi:hypothetical protein [Nocardia pseudobrasiliensis]|uniref:hypothetical protein n=1 Tax=Nocardia pseudobrasiliensis TaxID=45979 RepID=UPI00157C8CFD|nr:hypothetical protein [Nocardia pseudobrasiliensis]
MRLPFAEACPMGMYLLGEVSPILEYSKDKDAPKRQKVDLDKDGNGTGKRLWKATVVIPDGSNAKSVSYDVTFVADVRPVPSVGEAVPGMTPIVLEGMVVKPMLAGSGEFKSITWAIRATGIKGDVSGAKQPPANPGAARPARDEKAA